MTRGQVRLGPGKALMNWENGRHWAIVTDGTSQVVGKGWLCDYCNCRLYMKEHHSDDHTLGYTSGCGGFWDETTIWFCPKHRKQADRDLLMLRIANL